MQITLESASELALVLSQLQAEDASGMRIALEDVKNALASLEPRVKPFMGKPAGSDPEHKASPNFFRDRRESWQEAPRAKLCLVCGIPVLAW